MPTPEGLSSKVDGGLAQDGLAISINFKVSPETFLVSEAISHANQQNHIRKNRKRSVFKMIDFLAIIIVQFRWR